MSKRRLLTERQWQHVEKRLKIARRHCWKKIASDLGVNHKLLQKAVCRYRRAGIGGKVTR